MAKEHVKKGNMAGKSEPEGHEFIKTADNKERCQWCGEEKPA